jgi:hypothetical protein
LHGVEDSHRAHRLGSGWRVERKQLEVAASEESRWRQGATHGEGRSRPSREKRRPPDTEAPTEEREAGGEYPKAVEEEVLGERESVSLDLD